MNLNFRDIASKLSTRGWITVGAAALVGVLFIYMLMSMASSPSYTLLVGGQSPAQTQKITTALSTDGIAYQLTNNGTGVEVNPSDVGRARDVLDGQGLLSGAAGPLSSYIGSTSLGESQFQQQHQLPWDQHHQAHELLREDQLGEQHLQALLVVLQHRVFSSCPWLAQHQLPWGPHHQAHA